jgi:hypothetical protein
MITCGFIESSELATLRMIMPPGMDGLPEGITAARQSQRPAGPLSYVQLSFIAGNDACSESMRFHRLKAAFRRQGPLVRCQYGPPFKARTKSDLLNVFTRIWDSQPTDETASAPGGHRSRPTQRRWR